MFDFLFRGRKKADKPETKRDRFERLVGELNEMIAELPDKPAVTIAPGTGQISFAAPEQFMDEALALPKPEETQEAAEAKSDPQVEAATQATQGGDPVANQKRAAAPVPRPPVPTPPTPRGPS